MPIFPRAESDVVALAKRLIEALGHAQIRDAAQRQAALQQVIAEYDEAIRKRDELEALLKAANERKDTFRDALALATRRELARFEGDLDALPEGQGDELRRRIEAGLIDDTADVPAAPRDLRAVAEPGGVVSLSWRRPQRGRGGRVAHYIVLRRDASPANAEFQFQATALEPGIRLADQPSGREVVYAVVAKNRSGESAPSEPARVFVR